MRDVSSSAGQRNNSAVLYHFGDRAGLVGAVYVHRMSGIDARRREMLSALDARADVSSLVRVLVQPAVDEVVGDAGWYGRFMARTLWDPLAREVIDGLDVTDGLLQVGARLADQLDHLDAELRRHRLAQLISTVISTLAGWEWARHRGDAHLAPERLAADLTSTGTALLLAPSD